MNSLRVFIHVGSMCIAMLTGIPTIEVVVLQKNEIMFFCNLLVLSVDLSQALVHVLSLFHDRIILCCIDVSQFI